MKIKRKTLVGLIVAVVLVSTATVGIYALFFNSNQNDPSEPLKRNEITRYVESDDLDSPVLPNNDPANNPLDDTRHLLSDEELEALSEAENKVDALAELFESMGVVFDRKQLEEYFGGR